MFFERKMGHRNDYGKKLQMPSDYSVNEGGQKIHRNEEREGNHIGAEDTVFRYLCPLRKIGSIIGIGGDIAKQLRTETQARIRISETIPGCDERVITIYSSSEESNTYRDEAVSPAQDALFRVHEKVVAEEMPVNGSFEEPIQITARLLVPSDQIGCVIGKGGQIIQNIRNETHAQIRIMGTEHLPPCALCSDELIQITGDSTAVESSLYQISLRLHENPSRSQSSLLSSHSIYRSGIVFNNPYTGGTFLGQTSLMGPYRNHKNNESEWPSFSKEFTVKLVCPTENLGVVIGKGGSIIKQIRQDSGAFIVVDSSGADESHCLITVSAKEIFEAPSRSIDAIMRLQQRCSERIEKDSGEMMVTTRLLVSSSKIGCIIGKAGAIIKEMRNTTRASIRVISDDNVPKVASEDDEMVQITGDLNATKNALAQVLHCLRANLFESEGNSSLNSRQTHPSSESFEATKFTNRKSGPRNSGYPTQHDVYTSKAIPLPNHYKNYDDSQIVGKSGYRGYSSNSGGHSSDVSYGT